MIEKLWKSGIKETGKRQQLIWHTSMFVWISALASGAGTALAARSRGRVFFTPSPFALLPAALNLLQPLRKKRFRHGVWTNYEAQETTGPAIKNSQNTELLTPTPSIDSNKRRYLFGGISILQPCSKDIKPKTMGRYSNKKRKKRKGMVQTKF